VALTGLRQSGKTTLLKTLFKEKYKFVSFDDPAQRERALADPRLFLDNLGNNVIFDEIQYIPQILSYLKIIVDNNRTKKGLFILTGSQQFNLMKGLTETLAGRAAILNLLPFGRKERLKVSHLKHKLNSPYKDFTHSCLRGSFPEPLLYKNIDIAVWFASYLQTYLERDIRMIYDLGNIREFQLFLRILAARCAQVINLSNIARDIGVAVNTIKNWLSLLEASNIIYLLYPYYRNIGKRITKAPKVYFLDLGLVSYLTGIETEKQLINGPLAGAIFENYCILEIIKFFYHHGRRANIFYLRTHNGLEIDLIIEKEAKVYPIEIKFSKTLNLAMAKPIQRFKNIFSKLNFREAKIISLIPESYLLAKDLEATNLDNLLNWLEKDF
jgi:hypothetical protein